MTVDLCTFLVAVYTISNGHGGGTLAAPVSRPAVRRPHRPVGLLTRVAAKLSTLNQAFS